MLKPKITISKNQLSETGKLLDKGADSANTRMAINGAAKVYTRVTGGYLPCSPTDLLDFISLAYLSAELGVSSIQARTHHIAMWHKARGYDNPAADKRVQKRLKGLAATAGKNPKKVQGIDIVDLRKIVNALDNKISTTDLNEKVNEKRRRAKQLVAIRDKAMILTGFWFALRSDTISSLRVRNITITTTNKGKSMALGLHKTKTTSDLWIRNLSALPELCPIVALEDWLDASMLYDAPDHLVFPSISQWGALNTTMHRTSLDKVFDTIYIAADLKHDLYGTHSLRRGYANYAVDNGANLLELMAWVGWRDPKTVGVYIRATDDLPTKLLARSNNIEAHAESISQDIDNAAHAGKITIEEQTMFINQIRVMKKKVTESSVADKDLTLLIDKYI